VVVADQAQFDPLQAAAAGFLVLELHVVFVGFDAARNQLGFQPSGLHFGGVLLHLAQGQWTRLAGLGAGVDGDSVGLKHYHAALGDQR